jgi:hypothetical protein
MVFSDFGVNPSCIVLPAAEELPEAAIGQMVPDIYLQWRFLFLKYWNIVSG